MKQPYFQRVVSMSAMIILIGIFPPSLFAQPGDPGDDPDLPIDGGVSILIAAGVGYGVKKYRDHKRNNRSSNTGEV